MALQNQNQDHNKTYLAQLRIEVKKAKKNAKKEMKKIFMEKNKNIEKVAL